ncbi:MAG TPA: hypothetical protein VG755_36415 [Nannocystaceae bacterium]|nr:hypothetical protein [Nannocystaceae bacterium]
MTLSTLKKSLLLAASALAIGACADEGDDDGNHVVCAGAKCDAPTDPSQFACKNVTDLSERGRPNILAELNDPISVFVLRGGSGCPTSFKDAMKKLRIEDKAGCESGAAAGLSTRFVTESGQLDGGKLLQNFRAVVSRRCNSRQEFELLMSLFGIKANGTLPAAAEMIAFDPESKEFNYYEVSGGRWTYFGSSSDFVEKGPGQGDTRRCANCHTGGGLVMKELDTPWVNWTGHFQTPGTNKVIDANKDDLGSESSGANMESVVNAGNREWTKTRVTNALNPMRSDVKALLRPLFCTVEHNIDTAVDFDSSNFSGIPVDFLVDPAFKSFGSIGIKSDVYTAARDAAGFNVPGLAGQKDNIFKFAFIERSKADIMYTDELESRGVIDDDFTKDVLAIDFTRPVFSDARCSLLEFAPTFEQLDMPVPTDPTDGGTTGAGEESTGGETTGGETTGDPTAGGTTDPTGGTGSGNCCTADDTRKGCDNDTIEMCTCAVDSFCCESSWDATCVSEATESCMAMCTMGIVDDEELAFTDDVQPQAAVDAATIRALFIANIEKSNPAAGSPAAELLANLKNTADAQAHTDRVNAFLKACEDRDEAEMMTDAFKIHTWQRETAFNLPVMEFQQTMATTNLNVSSTIHLDATSCKAVD